MALTNSEATVLSATLPAGKYTMSFVGTMTHSKLHTVGVYCYRVIGASPPGTGVEMPAMTAAMVWGTIPMIWGQESATSINVSVSCYTTGPGTANMNWSTLTVTEVDELTVVPQS